MGALSRSDDETEVCTDCGVDEARLWHGEASERTIEVKWLESGREALTSETGAAVAYIEWLAEVYHDTPPGVRS